MQATKIKNIPISSREISVVTSENTDTAMRHSCKFAESAHGEGLNVLIINCGVSPTRFRDHAPKATTFFHYDNDDDEFVLTPNSSRKPGQPELVTFDSVRGNLIAQEQSVKYIVDACRIQVVVIVGWEWSSSSWRRRERLLYLLRELAADKSVAFVVYAQTTTKPVAGENDRGGIGKLASIAFAINDLKGTELSGALDPAPPPLLLSVSDWVEAERSAQLLINKINGITVTPDVTTPQEKFYQEYAPTFADEDGSSDFHMKQRRKEERKNPTTRR
jgi:hypothetical protein